MNALLEPAARAAGGSLVRRMAAMFYETLIVTALLMFGFLLPHIILGAFAGLRAPQWMTKAHVFLLLLVYFTWFWIHGGQTLAMKTWKLRVVDAASGGRLRPMQAVLRYMAAWFSVALLGIGFLWALIDRDRQFLHDRIAGTRIVVA